MMGGRGNPESFSEQRSAHFSDQDSGAGMLKSFDTTTKSGNNPRGSAPKGNLGRGPERPRFGGSSSAQTARG